MPASLLAAEYDTIVEYHLVYAMILVYLGSIHAGRIGGLEKWIGSWEPFASRPGLRAWLA